MYLQEEEADETRPLLAAGIDNWQWQEDQGDLDMRMMVKAFPGKIATTTKQVIFKNFLGELKLSFEVFSLKVCISNVQKILACCLIFFQKNHYKINMCLSGFKPIRSSSA